MSREDEIIESSPMKGGPKASKPFLSSDRERRLWAWTVAVVVAIYSTLGLARKLAGMLRDRDLFAVYFATGMLLAVVALLALALKTRPGGAEIGVALGVAAVYLMVLFRMGVTEERTHLFEYGVLAVFIYEALRERASQGRRVPVPALFAVGATALVGVVNECIQAFLPPACSTPRKTCSTSWLL